MVRSMWHSMAMSGHFFLQKHNEFHLHVPKSTDLLYLPLHES